MHTQWMDLTDNYAAYLTVMHMLNGMHILALFLYHGPWSAMKLPMLTM